jgi:hypothetical protein
MKKLKLLTLIGLLTGIISTGFSFADPIDLKITALGHQIKGEIVDVMNLPVYLKYTDKNLNGSVDVLIAVQENGKINIININGDNKNLNNYVFNKIATRNMWTDTKYKGKMFRYRINLISK